MPVERMAPHIPRCALPTGTHTGQSSPRRRNKKKKGGGEVWSPPRGPVGGWSSAAQHRIYLFAPWVCGSAGIGSLLTCAASPAHAMRART